MQKVLVLSYFFKPCNITASNRTTYWAENFYKYNIYPIIVTRKWEREINFLHDSSYSTSKGIHEDTNNIRSIYYLPFKGNIKDRLINKYGYHKLTYLRKFFTFIELLLQNYFVGFLPYSNFYYFTRKLLLKNKDIKTIIASGNPFHLFFIAYLLKIEFPYIEWIADYRDEWTTHPLDYVNYNKLLYNIEKQKEKKWLSNAYCFTFVNDYQLNNIAEYINKTGYTISNGYETDSHMPSTLDANHLVLTYTGTLYPYQDLDPFVHAIRKLNDQIKDVKLIINFIGADFTPGSKNRILQAFNGLEKYVRITKRIPKANVLEEMAIADAFIAFQGLDNIVDSKIYEYLPFYKPIIVCTTSNQLLISLLTTTGLGKIAIDSNELYDIIFSMYINKQQNIPLHINANTDEIIKYSRVVQTEKLANLINNIN